MSPTLSLASRPKRPGAYLYFVGERAAIIPPAVGSVVAVPFVHDWGPAKEVVPLNSFSEFTDIFGPETDSPGYVAVSQAFRGEGLPGFGGAGQVLAYRMGGTAQAQATLTLQNTTPAPAVTAKARYPGLRGNDLRITVQNNASDALKSDLLVLDGTLLLETWTYPDADISDLVGQIGGSGVLPGSDWIEATMLIDDVPLAPISGSSLTGGNDGGTLTSAEWTQAMAAFDVERFGVFAPFDLTDTAIITSLRQWVVDSNASGKRFQVVVGGAVDESATTAATRAATLNSEDILTIGVGSVRDANLLDASGQPRVLSTAQLAPRVAGIYAFRGEVMALTFARMSGLTILNGASAAQIVDLFERGVLVLTRDSNLDAPTRIEKGVNTFQQSAQTADKPWSLWRVPANIRTMSGVQVEFQEWGEANVIGKQRVNDKTRQAAIAEVSARMRARENAGTVQPGWTVGITQSPPPSDDDDFISIDIAMHFGRFAEQVLFTVVVG